LGLLLLAHCILGVSYRTWSFMAGMAVGLILEIGGYAARIAMHDDPFDFNTFVIQLVCLTIGPAFMTASIYLSLSRLIVIYGAHIAPFAPKTYTYTFVACDVVSLILQATGGGLAASANTKADQDTGVDVMIAGLVFQVVSIALFISLSVNFWLRIKKATYLNPDPQFERVRRGSFFLLYPVGKSSFPTPPLWYPEI